MTENTRNICILGKISEEELVNLYSRCQDLICTAIDEDFGLTPTLLESISSGKLVIAVVEGGFLEIITPECGIFVRPAYEDIIYAVGSRSQNPEPYCSACRTRGSLFGISPFEYSIQETVNETFHTWSDTA